MFVEKNALKAYTYKLANSNFYAYYFLRYI